MIKALWFMVKAGLLVALAVWLATRPGTITLQWMEYTFHVHLGLFLFCALAAFISAILLYNIVRGFLNMPRSYRRYRNMRRREKGYRALTQGLTAVAAGDAKEANKQARRAVLLLNEDGGLPRLLEAQAARLEGREDDARKSFVKLLDHRDASFLGVRGLLQAALDYGNHEKARELAYMGLNLHPKQPWILRVVYDIELKLRNWTEARQILSRAEKAGAIEPVKAARDRTAIALAQAEQDLDAGREDEALKRIKTAYKNDPGFVPAAYRLARLYKDLDRPKKAAAVIEKTWKNHPHPDLVYLWDALFIDKNNKKPMERVNWFERLVSINPEAAEGHMAAGRVAMEEKLWGEARQHFMKAEMQGAGANVYKSLARLEEKEFGNSKAAEQWLEKAADAPPDKAWICRETGRQYAHWSPVAQPHGAFNTIEWMRPERPAEQDRLQEGSLQRPKLINDPLYSTGTRS